MLDRTRSQALISVHEGSGFCGSSDTRRQAHGTTSQLWVARKVNALQHNYPIGDSWTWNKNGMDAGGVLFFLVARAVCACIYVMVLLLLLC